MSKDMLKNINEEAAYNLTHQEDRGGDIQYFGDYGFVPVQESRASLIKEAIEKINSACEPTLRSLQIMANRIELQDRIYNRLQTYTYDANECIKGARNVKEVNYCSDVYINRLRTEMMQETLNILKDY